VAAISLELEAQTFLDGSSARTRVRPPLQLSLRAQTG